MDSSGVGPSTANLTLLTYQAFMQAYNGISCVQAEAGYELAYLFDSGCS